MRFGADVRYHPRDRCTYCGAHAGRQELHVVLEHATRARALLCVDTVACERRRKRMRDRRAA